MLLDEPLQDLRARVVGEPVSGVHRLQVQDDVRAPAEPAGFAYGVGAITRGFPTGGRRGSGSAGDNLDAVRHHEGRIEADPELPDQCRRGLVRGAALQLLDQFPGPRLRDRADQRAQLVASHADAAVAHGERARLTVGHELDLEHRVGVQQRGMCEGLELQLVERVGGVRQQLAQEDLLVRVQRVNDDVEELAGLGLEGKCLAGSHSNILLPPAFPGHQFLHAPVDQFADVDLVL